MSMDFTEVEVDPNELRFSQDSIAEYVRTPWGQNVQLSENLSKLKSGELHPNDFPPLEICRDENGVLWSNDNRRLWLFRKAGISQITVKLFSQPLSRVPPRVDSDRVQMSRPDFFPRVRRSEWIKVDPSTIRFSQISIDPYFTSRLGQKDRLEENLKKLRSGVVKSDDFHLDISRDEDGVLWSNDNERLWLLRKAGVSQIKVNIFDKLESREPPRSDSDRFLMSSPDFFPSIRGQLQADNSEVVVKLNPNLIRFSEKSIAPYWTTSSGNGFLLEENLKILKSGRFSPDDFPALDVSRDEDGLLWSNDNEGLWLFRKAGVSPITVKVFRKPLSRAPPRSDRDRALMCSPDFFPTMRGKLQETGSSSTIINADDIDSVIKLNPNLIRFSEKSIAPCWTTSSRKSFLLEENLKMLKSGRLSPDNFPALDVSRDEDGLLWSNDNEGLWLFRKAGILQITVKVFRKPLSRTPPRSDRDRALMSSPNFFPTIRGQSKETAPPKTNLKPDDIDSEVKLNPNSIRFSEMSIGPYWTKSSERNVLLEEILKKLKSGRLTPDVFQPLEVSRDKDGALWANDNEILWFLRKAGVSEISVKVSSRPLSTAPPRSDSDRALMSSPDFFPSIREQSQETASTWTDIKADDIVGLLLGAAVTIFLGYSGWKLSTLVGCAVWKLYKNARD